MISSIHRSPAPNSGTISTSSIRESSGWWQTQITHLAKEIWVIYTKSQTWFGAISYSLMYGCPIWIRTLWLCHVFRIPISGKSHLSSLSLAITQKISIFFIHIFIPPFLLAPCGSPTSDRKTIPSRLWSTSSAATISRSSPSFNLWTPSLARLTKTRSIWISLNISMCV